MFSYSAHPHKINCDCDWSNNYKANEKKFLVKVKQKLEQSLRKNIIKELTDIQVKKQSLRSPHLSPFPNYPWLFTNDTITFAKFRHVNSFFKYINAMKYVHYSHDYILCKFMKICYMKAYDLIFDIRNLTSDMVEWPREREYIVFNKKRNIKNLLHNLRTFINRYEYQKYYIIHIIQQTVRSDDLIRLIYSFVCP